MADFNTSAGLIYRTIYAVAAAEQHVDINYANRVQSLAADYQPSLKEVLGHEGGYTNEAQDPGGPTNWGITIYDARMYWKKDATAADVKAMPLSVAKEIYKAKYWDKVRGDELPAGVDYTVFDYTVNSGASRAIKVLQRVLGENDDGVLGDRTMRAVLAHCQRPDAVKWLINTIQNERLLFLKGLRIWPTYKNGWTRRVEEVRALALKMADQPQQPAPQAPKTSRPVQPPMTNPSKPPVPTPLPAGHFMTAIAAVLKYLFGRK